MYQLINKRISIYKLLNQLSCADINSKADTMPLGDDANCKRMKLDIPLRESPTFVTRRIRLRDYQFANN